MYQQTNENHQADLDKEVPLSQPEIVNQKAIDPEDLNIMVPSNELKVEADLYHNIVYTVVPKDHSLELGIFPEDQQFSGKYVFVWSSYRDLLRFSEDVWKKVKVKMPQGKRFEFLTPMVGGAYSLTHIPNTWHLEPVTSQPIYE